MHVCGHHVEDVLSFSYLFLQILNVVAVARHEVLNVEGKEQEKERSSASAPKVWTGQYKTHEQRMPVQFLGALARRNGLEPECWSTILMKIKIRLLIDQQFCAPARCYAHALQVFHVVDQQ